MTTAPSEKLIRARGGRPSKLTEEALEKAEHYVENFKEYGDVVPTVVGMALALGVSTVSVYKWAQSEDPNERFVNSFMKIDQLQHKGLVNGGLTGGFNPAVTKMMLTNHGYSDSRKIDHSSTDGSMSPPTTITLVAMSADGDE